MGCVSLPDHDKPFRVLIRERAQEHGFDDAEDGRVRADAEGQCERPPSRQIRATWSIGAWRGAGRVQSSLVGAWDGSEAILIASSGNKLPSHRTASEIL